MNKQLGNIVKELESILVGIITAYDSISEKELNEAIGHLLYIDRLLEGLTMVATETLESKY